MSAKSRVCWSRRHGELESGWEKCRGSCAASVGCSWKYLHESGTVMQSVDFCHEGLLMSREFLAGRFVSLGDETS